MKPKTASLRYAVKMKKDLVSFIATGLFTGLLPKAPGTFGSLAAIVIFLAAGMSAWAFYPLLMLVLIVSVPASAAMERRLKTKDPQVVTIDEVAGMLLTMATFPSPFADGTVISWIILASGFVLFRFFDILKPFPIRQSQALKSGWGIVIDDIIAGIFSNLILQVIFRLLIHYHGTCN